MLEHPKERERKLSRMLKNFHRDQKQLAAALRRLIEKGPAVRIKDFKAMIKAFHIEHHEEISGVDEILEEFERVKDEIGSQWRKVIAIESKGEYRAPLVKP
jgi:ferritin